MAELVVLATLATMAITTTAMATLASFLSPKVSSRQIIMGQTAKVHHEMREVVAVALTIWQSQQRPPRSPPQQPLQTGLNHQVCLCTIPITLFTFTFRIATQQMLNGGQRIKLQFYSRIIEAALEARVVVLLQPIQRPRQITSEIRLH